MANLTYRRDKIRRNHFPFFGMPVVSRSHHWPCGNGTHAEAPLI
ncbi:MAG: hypothetical protein P0Y65_14765 [Candidatus Devosia phytovorans]|uniref:Uncharacterized protein n=1 Tax=Candidatus Devosia phytovorans TaxID=3121372 RepID=A0AAJ5VRQ7_9HYPH|nr:hypothetical protein [Devosia sp.]WEK03449.1 MAG: hypothetical protein P0Y65_14765 [Devosia sp.]